MDDPITLFEALKRSRPRAARLALRTCLPVRVSPQFVRQARLCLMAGSSSGDEADLWLSELVETRSAAGFSYRRAVRDWLRQQLAGDSVLLDDLWQRVHREHAKWLTPRACMEEELTWRLLRDRSDPAIDVVWRSVVKEMDEEPHAEGLARWVIRAQSDLPEGTLEHEAGRLAYYGAHLLLGDASVLGEQAQQFLASGELNFATRRLPKRRIFVGLSKGGGLLIEPAQPFKHGHAVDLPATRPLWLQLEGADASSTSAPVVITMDGLRSIHRSLGTDALTLRLIDGAAYKLSPPLAQQRFTRNKTSRVRLEYHVELADSLKSVRLPFVVGVLSDLAGQSRGTSQPPVERRFVNIDANNFNYVMAQMRPRVAFVIPPDGDKWGPMRIDLTLISIEDFSPAALLRNVDGLRLQLETRQKIAGILQYLTDESRAVPHIAKLMNHGPLFETLARPESTPYDASFLYESLKPHFGEDFVVRFLDDLAFTSEADQFKFAQSLMALVRATAVETGSRKGNLRDRVLAVLATLDSMLSRHINNILHHPEFQRLEGAWRGLHHLVSRTETDESLQIRVMHMNRDELQSACTVREGGPWDECTLFKKVHEDTFGQSNGTPFGCMVADFYLDHSPVDIALMSTLARIGSTAHAPFILGALPSIFGLASWKAMTTAHTFDADLDLREHDEWNYLRDSEDARYLFLAAPRFLARFPHEAVNVVSDQESGHAASDPAPEFRFEEAYTGLDGVRFVWANSAYAMAAVITRSFAQHGWCAAIEGADGGGLVRSLPIAIAPDFIGSLEVALSEQGERQLAESGLLPFTSMPSHEGAAFLSLSSMYRPSHLASDMAEQLMKARLHFVLTTSRFAHYLKCMVRDRVGSFESLAVVEQYLQNWLLGYVNTGLVSSTEEMQLHHPLSDASIQITQGANLPYSTAIVELGPYFHLPRISSNIVVLMRLPRDL